MVRCAQPVCSRFIIRPPPCLSQPRAPTDLILHREDLKMSGERMKYLTRSLGENSTNTEKNMEGPISHFTASDSNKDLNMHM